MAEELKQIIEHIQKGHNFLLSGGAGSGKTYTLVQVIKKIIESDPSSTICCITYTNAAVREIAERVNHPNLRVSTIHDFLWDCISNFQNELKQSIIQLINDELIKVNITDKSIPADIHFFNEDSGPVKIQYKEYIKLREGIISHDEVIKVAHYMFSHYSKLRNVVKGCYSYILVDEYQDTDPTVVDDLLHYIGNDSGNIIGFFGDSMQAIYDNGVGDLKKYIYPSGNVYEVKKEQNRRCPLTVIELANKIRLDDLKQQPSEDTSAPNMANGKVKDGRIVFIYSKDDNTSIENVRQYLREKEGWDFSDPRQTKELNLTHNLIAGKAGFGTLMEIHNKDGILNYRAKIKKFVEENRIGTSGKTLGDVLYVLETKYKGERRYAPTKGSQAFIDAHPDLLELAKGIAYDSFMSMFVSSDQLVDDKKQDEDEKSRTGSKRSDLVKHLMKIERCIALYKNNQVSDFLRSTEWEINSLEDKKRLRLAIDQLINVGDKTVRDIIDEADSLGIVRKDDALERYADRNKYVYERVMETPYDEVQALYRYLEGMTPFSTQHKTKGTEFDNVFVILDNGRWNSYNFERLFTAECEALNDSVVRRTRKIFYVCCTRTKENLAVYYHLPSDEVLTKAREWFGGSNVIEI